MEAVPNGEKHQRRNVTDVLVIEKFETFVHVLENPQVGLHVEGGDVVVKAVSVFENAQLDVLAPAPVLHAGLLVARHKR